MFGAPSRRPVQRPASNPFPSRSTCSRSARLRGGLFVCGLLTAFGSAAQEPSRWTLTDALARAATASPALRVREADLATAASRLVGARIVADNPTLSIELANRRGPSGSTTDRGLSVAQPIAVAGQRRKRIAVANEGLRAAEATWLHDQNTLAGRVASAFVESVRGREHEAIARLEVDLAREMLAQAERRLARGATTQIEVNLAQASAGRAERSRQQARAAYFAARSHLALLAGADPTQPPEPLGALRLARDELAPLDELVRQARSSRGDLQSAARQEQAAEAAIRLALAERRPKLEIGGFFQREEGTEDILGATVSVSIPVFDRNQGRIAASRAARTHSRHQHEALELAIDRQVATALNDLGAARAAAAFLRDQVLGTLEENVDLLQRAYDAGRIRVTELMTLQRELVAGQRAYVDVLADAWQARIALDLATGSLTLPQPLSAEAQP